MIFVFDSYNKAVQARIPEISEMLKTFVYILAKEELRECFVGRETYKILNLKKKIK